MDIYMLLYMCVLTLLYVCVIILIYMCAFVLLYMCPHTAICVLILLCVKMSLLPPEVHMWKCAYIGTNMRRCQKKKARAMPGRLLPL